MKRSDLGLRVLLVVVLCVLGVWLDRVLADITTTGNVEPSSPWTSGTTGYVGKTADGTLRVDGGSSLYAYDCYLGYNSGVTGTATVTGSGSLWKSLQLVVGKGGTGTLTIQDGAQVSSYYAGCLGGLSGSQGVATVTGAGSKWTCSEELLVGYGGAGTLTIQDGAQVSSGWSYLGFNPGSQGTGTVTGSGSKWTISGDLYVGSRGAGTLTIQDGAQVSISWGYLGYESSGQGVATVTGNGSKWTCSSRLYVGYNGAGTLNIVSGGEVAANQVAINSSSLLAIDVGRGSRLSVGTSSGTITNNGKIRILAGADAASGSQHTPIAAGAWSGAGVYQAVGGTWDPVSHVFTVSGVQSGVSGTAVSLNLSQVQRTLIHDPTSGWTVGASFLNKPGEINFTATAMSGQVLSELQDRLGAGEGVLSAWEFTVSGSGYSQGDPVYLSFDVGPGLSRSVLSVWRYDGSDWSAYTAADLVYTGQYASFTVTGFSGYAISGPVTLEEIPEPSTLALLLVGLFSLLAWARHKRILSR